MLKQGDLFCLFTSCVWLNSYFCEDQLNTISHVKVARRKTRDVTNKY